MAGDDECADVGDETYFSARAGNEAYVREGVGGRGVRRRQGRGPGVHRGGGRGRGDRWRWGPGVRRCRLPCVAGDQAYTVARKEDETCVGPGSRSALELGTKRTSAPETALAGDKDEESAGVGDEACVVVGAEADVRWRRGRGGRWRRREGGVCRCRGRGRQGRGQGRGRQGQGLHCGGERGRDVRHRRVRGGCALASGTRRAPVSGTRHVSVPGTMR